VPLCAWALRACDQLVTSFVGWKEGEIAWQSAW